MDPLQRVSFIEQSGFVEPVILDDRWMAIFLVFEDSRAVLPERTSPEQLAIVVNRVVACYVPRRSSIQIATVRLEFDRAVVNVGEQRAQSILLPDFPSIWWGPHRSRGVVPADGIGTKIDE